VLSLSKIPYAKQDIAWSKCNQLRDSPMMMMGVYESIISWVRLIAIAVDALKIA
jgi:hypothetical protein